MTLELAPFAFDFIGRQEGCERWDPVRQLCFPYRDPIGLWTVGKGHLIKPGESFAAGLTLDQVDELLRVDCTPALRALDAPNVRVPLTLHQIAALVSWLINVGVGWAYRPDCSVIRELNLGHYPEAAHWLEAYDVAGGEHRPWLLARRRAEEALFMLPDEPTDGQKGQVLELAGQAAAIKLALSQQFDLTDGLGLATPLDRDTLPER